MERSHCCILVMAFLLVGMLAFVSQFRKAEAADSPPLTINADGSITPSTTLMISTDNITYTLTDNITVNGGWDVINVQRDNIILDGAGYTIQHAGVNRGLQLSDRNNVTVKNLRITDCGDGIVLNSNTWITIDHCTITGNGRGVFNGYTHGPWNFTFTNNEVRARTDAVSLAGITDSVISGNTIQGSYGLVLYGDENVTIKDNLITGCTWGMWPLSSASNISIFDNTFASNSIGVSVGMGSHPTLKIYHNYFINNNEPATAEGGNCTWDDGYPSGGNYWSGYVSPDLFSGPYQNITGGDGMGDNPFRIYRTTDVWDYYPRMFVSVCNVSQNPPQGSVTSTDTVSVNATVTHLNPLEQVILNCTYTNSSATWTNSVNMTNVEGDIWNGIIPSLPVGTNVTYAIVAQDEAGNSINSKSQGYTFDYPVAVPEFPTYALLPMLFAATLFAVLVLRRKRVGSFH